MISAALAFILSPVGRWATAAGSFVVLLGVSWAAGDIHGHKVKQAELDALKLSYTKAWDAELARSAAVSDTAISGLKTQLAASDANTVSAEQRVSDLQAYVASIPEVAGRGATAADVKALNK